MLYRRLKLALLSLILLSFVPGYAWAETPSPAQMGEKLRTDLLQAQLALLEEPAEARQFVAEAQTLYQASLAAPLNLVAPQAHQRILSGFSLAQESLAAEDGRALALARAQIWTGLLAGSYQQVEVALQGRQGQIAREWLPLREFRQATRFSRPNADATLAVKSLIEGQVNETEALLAVRADLLDTYQARLTEALNDLEIADQQDFALRRTEHAALAEGYFVILSAAYREQRGGEALTIAQGAFAELRTAAYEGLNLTPALEPVKAALHNFRAAPLSPKEQSRRAGQLLRYLSLVPVEYERGVSGGRVTKEIEIQEAVTFRDGAAAAFADLQNLLDARDPAKTTQAAGLLTTLQTQLSAASSQSEIPSPEAVETNVEQLRTLLAEVMPTEWQQGDTAGDFDVIFSMLDQMEVAVRAGEYDLAESARLEAYAIFDIGPELRLLAFAPNLVAQGDGLFWHGYNGRRGLAEAIASEASPAEIKQIRADLDQVLAESQRLLGNGASAPAAVIFNAAIIVFREGLEAVVILAALMASLVGAYASYRKPMIWGAVLAFLATAITWVIAQQILLALGGFGEKLEAVVSLIAIGVLLLITNWFFHKVYWKDWLKNFHTQKKQILGGQAGQLLGLTILGFTSIYREGFETVLFLQALVLDAGAFTVLQGVLLGLAGVGIVGLLTFKLQRKLPYKKMLVVTGILIGGVLLVMVGHTVHVLQAVNWLTITPLHNLSLPYWLGLWFGVFPTWEGIAGQIAAAVFVIGSYYLAEYNSRRKRVSKASLSVAEAESTS
jgi:high-affinity iron transporter